VAAAAAQLALYSMAHAGATSFAGADPSGAAELLELQAVPKAQSKKTGRTREVFCTRFIKPPY
jgi:hypothetical protein